LDGAAASASLDGARAPDAEVASASAPPVAASPRDHVDDHPTPQDESTMMSNPRPLTSSSFDDEDLVDAHPVPDRGNLTHSAFDDEDLIDRHPASDEPAFTRNPRPLTSSSFDDEDLIDRHPVSDEPAFTRNPPPLTSSSFDDEDLIDRHPVPR
jgi:hypothetical protein